MQLSYRCETHNDKHERYPEVHMAYMYDQRTGLVQCIAKLGVNKETVEILGTSTIHDETDFENVGKLVYTIAKEYPKHKIITRIYDGASFYFGHYMMWNFRIASKFVGNITASNARTNLMGCGYILEYVRDLKPTVPQICTELDELVAASSFCTNDLLSI